MAVGSFGTATWVGMPCPLSLALTTAVLAWLWPGAMTFCENLLSEGHNIRTRSLAPTELFRWQSETISSACR